MALETALDLDQLPGSVRELTECIGLNAALALVDAYGGTRVWIPEQYQPQHPLAKVIGVTAAKTLVGRYALDHLMIPKCAAALRSARDQAVRARYDEGETARTLARAYGITETRIYQIVAVRPHVGQTQQSLF
ncbi:MAG: hypothetical protein HYX63_13480 [Gammaproteobacteria bacterium]|nr:hypothetical protein [Gammaproteobacteria bacterium]